MIDWVQDHIGQIVVVLFVLGCVGAAVDGFSGGGGDCRTEWDVWGSSRTDCR